ERQPIRPHSHRHDNFFERCIAGTLSNSVDCAFHLACTGFNCCEAVGDAQAQVVMAMYADSDVIAYGDDTLVDSANEWREFRWQRVTDRIRNVQDRSPRINRSGQYIAEVINIAARCVLG